MVFIDVKNLNLVSHEIGAVAVLLDCGVDGVERGFGDQALPLLLSETYSNLAPQTCDHWMYMECRELELLERHIWGPLTGLGHPDGHMTIHSVVWAPFRTS